MSVRIIDGLVYDAQSDSRKEHPNPVPGFYSNEGLPDLSELPPLTPEEIRYLEIPSYERALRLMKILETQEQKKNFPVTLETPEKEDGGHE